MNNQKKRPYLYVLMAFVLLTNFIVLPGYIKLFDNTLNKISENGGKIIPNVNSVFSKIDLKYKDSFLPSDYKIDKIGTNKEDLKEWGIVLNNSFDTSNISSFSIENPDNSNGTANFCVNFQESSKFDKLVVPISGFLTNSQSFWVNIGDGIISDNVFVPSYLNENNEYIKNFIYGAKLSQSDDANINRADINVDYLLLDGDSGLVVAKFNYHNRITSKIFKITDDATLISKIMDALKVNEITTKNYQEINANFNTIDTAFDTSLLSSYKYIPNLLSLKLSTNDTQSNVTYMLSYNNAKIEKTINIATKVSARKSYLENEEARLHNPFATIFYKKENNE